MKPLFLNPPTFEDFDGGAGARYQASREVTSFWYPTWLCFPAGMIEGSRVVDAPVQKFTLEDCLTIARDFDMVVMYTSTPTLMIDIETARRIKEVKPAIVTVLTGPHVTILPEESLRAGKGPSTSSAAANSTIPPRNSAKDEPGIRSTASAFCRTARWSTPRTAP